MQESRDLSAGLRRIFQHSVLAVVVVAVVVGCLFGGIWLLAVGPAFVGVVVVTAGWMLGMAFLFLS